MFSKADVWKDLFPTFDEFVEFIQWTDVDFHHEDVDIPIDVYVTTVRNIIHHCSSYKNTKYLIDDMDYVGRLESLQDDLCQIAERVGVQVFEVPHLNKSKSCGYRDYYSKRSRSLVQKLYQDDLDRFKYVF